MFGMTLIDLPLSEVAVVSAVVDNIFNCGGAICVFFDLGISESLFAAVVCSSGIAAVIIFVAT